MTHDKMKNRTHVWVRIDMAEAMLEHGGRLPPNWSPSTNRIRRERSSNKFDWVWARGYLLETQQSHRKTKNGETTTVKSASSPFGHVKLRKVRNSPISSNGHGHSPSSSSQGSPSSWSSPSSPILRRQHSTGPLTVVIHDAEFAPYYLQDKSITIDDAVIDGEDVLCMANSWWWRNNKKTDSSTPDDLTTLTHLHEPAVVFCLKQRYERDLIYTYTGKILLALNPFRVCQQLYGESVMQQYWDDTTDTTKNRPPPHIYAVAQDAYGSMMRAMEMSSSTLRSASDERMNQSILVSGESGAGKTETTKIIMRYLANMSRRHLLNEDPKNRKAVAVDGGGIESQVLQSNPILESFGNARTVRNDNSSRFGKFIEIMFLPSGCLVSATIETYLLEKVRLISQAPGERNFHVFYELLSGLSQKERRDLIIGNKTAHDFRITSVSGTFDRRDGIDDRSTYRELREALTTVGFSQSEQTDLFSVACALLHASNLEFVETASDSTQLDRSNPALKPVLELLGVSRDALENALCLCAIEARGETLYKNLSLPKATKALEALIKATYGALFSHIVRRVNSSITVHHRENGGSNGQHSQSGQASINCLDIFGFESFKVNSFEQLCINYCNEALQQQFNRFVFKLEQEEYERQGIEWSFITFPDNQDILDLVEQKPAGLLSILDEWCRIPRATDMSFARAAYDKCASHPRFEATNAQRGLGTFSVRHYAGEVEYDTLNFLEKNRDELSTETIDLLVSSSNEFIAGLGNAMKDMSSVHLRSPSPTMSEASSAASGSGAPGRRGLRRSSSSIMRDSVGSQFSAQLRQLRFRIDETTPHYVRCLKPNDELVPNSFNPVVIADQLRCAGVLEAIRVSRVGFPHRYNHEAFVERYHMLARDRIERFIRIRKGRDLCEVLVNAVSMRVGDSQLVFEGGKEETGEISPTRVYRSARDSVDAGIQMGRTKVFLRRQSFETLEFLRRQITESAVMTMQAYSRQFLDRQRYLRCIRGGVVIQSFVRRIKAARIVTQLRRNRSAMMIQCAWRSFVAERYFIAALTIAQWGQSTRRGIVARDICAFMLLDYKATIIQKNWRRSFALERFHTVLRGILLVQALHRAHKARLEFRQRKKEARDLGKVAEERDKFRNEAIRLQRELEKTKEQKGGPPDEVEKLRREVELLQLQLRKAQFGSGAQLLAREAAGAEKAIETPPRTPRSLGESNASRNSFPSKVNVTKDSPDNTVSSFGGPAHASKSGSPQRRTPQAPRPTPSPVRSSIFRSPHHTPTRHDRPSSAKSPGSTSLLDIDDIDDEDFQMAEMATRGVNDSPASWPSRQIGQLGVASPALDTTKGALFVDDAFNFRKAVHQGDEEVAELILETSKFADVLINDSDHNGHCPLHIAALTSNESIARLLLKYDAASNVQDAKGNTPLHLANSHSMIELLLGEGRANPNIPNSEGICALHLAVGRLDVLSVQCILRHKADVNAADHSRWYTALHVVSQPSSEVEDSGHLLEVLSTVEEKPVRSQIAGLLCEVTEPSEPDMDFQDKEGNTPLHHAVMLTTEEAGDVMSVFLDNGSNPNIANSRGQTPLHLLCHNDSLRSAGTFQEMLHDILFHGADPNQPSLTGCTALHLSLYHRDIDSAIQLIHNGAELHLVWRKPKRWQSFWDDMGTSEVLPLDMVEDEHSLHRLLAAITQPQNWAPSRPWCMHCKAILGTFARALHCRHCGRLICGACSPRSLNAEFFPKSFEVYESSWVCTVCEKILVSRKEENSSTTQPTTSFHEDDEDRDF